MEELTGFERCVTANTSEGITWFALYEDDVQDGDRVYATYKGTAMIFTVNGIASSMRAIEGNHRVTEEVICKLDTKAYDERVELRNKKQALKKQMDDVIQSVDDIHKYNIYAEHNDEVRELLDEYNSL